MLLIQLPFFGVGSYFSTTSMYHILNFGKIPLNTVCGQSYKHFKLVNYDSKLVITSKLLILITLES